MMIYEAIMIAEGDTPSTQEDYAAAWQHLINTGTCWNLQGWFGRQAAHLIEEGVCTLPTQSNINEENEK